MKANSCISNKQSPMTRIETVFLQVLLGNGFLLMFCFYCVLDVQVTGGLFAQVKIKKRKRRQYLPVVNYWCFNRSRCYFCNGYFLFFWLSVAGGETRGWIEQTDRWILYWSIITNLHVILILTMHLIISVPTTFYFSIFSSTECFGEQVIGKRWGKYLNYPLLQSYFSGSLFLYDWFVSILLLSYLIITKEQVTTKQVTQ